MDWLNSLLAVLCAVAIVSTSVYGTLPVFEVRLAVVGMAFAGSLMAFAYSPPVVSRKRMYGYAVGGVFIGLWGLKLLQWYGVGISPEYEPMFAGTIALISQQVIPPIVEAIPKFCDAVIDRFMKRTNNSDER